MDLPDLSVVVTVVEGPAALRRCLAALAGQEQSPSLEILVPYDTSIPWVSDVVGEFQGVHGLDMGSVLDPGVHHEGDRHELYDRRRARGLSAATGAVLALIEDRSVPRPEWSRTLVAVHQTDTVGALGGAVEPRAHTTLGWAIYFCDYGRYQLPFQRGERAYVSDVNVSYPRGALEGLGDIWSDRYNEAVVHHALKEAGRPLILDPNVILEHGRLRTGLRSDLTERFHWGRVFGGTRVASMPTAARLTRAALTPVLPILVWVRLLRGRLERGGRTLGHFFLATPAILLFLLFWSLGEAAAYLTPRRAQP